jgi:hypothetical protein
MKTLQHFLLGLIFFTGAFSQAQVTVNVNVGSPPNWGPAGYTDVRYYYLPDIDTYYDISTGQYIYITNGNWIRATALPPAYRGYNLYNGYKVVITDYRDATPYVYYKIHKAKYPKGYKGAPQKNIGVPPGLAKKGVTHAPGNSNKAAKGNGNKNKGNGNGKGKH